MKRKIEDRANIAAQRHAAVVRGATITAALTVRDVATPVVRKAKTGLGVAVNYAGAFLRTLAGK
jgi:hypothetical protein